jgi:hypothetical protein
MSGTMRSLGFVAGVDLGARQDHSAIVIVEKIKPVAPEAEPADTWPSPYRVPAAETSARAWATALGHQLHDRCGIRHLLE